MNKTGTCKMFDAEARIPLPQLHHLLGKVAKGSSISLVR